MVLAVNLLDKNYVIISTVHGPLWLTQRLVTISDMELRNNHNACLKM